LEEINTGWLGQGCKGDCVSATGLGGVRSLIPGQITWFSYFYAAVGFGFGL